LIADSAAPGFGDYLSDLQLPGSVNIPPETSNSTRAIIRGALRWLYAEQGRADEGIALSNAIPFRYEVKKRKRYPTRDEITAFTKEAAKLPSPRREMVLIPLALGLRANEYLSLSRAAVEQAVATKVLTVLRKGGKEGELPATRVVPLLRSLLKAGASVDNLRDSRPWEFVWEAYSLTPRGAYWTMRRLVVSIAKESQTGTWTPHMLRHAFATEMIRDGAPLPIVQQALGHASYQTTISTYVHLDTKDLEKWMAPPEKPKDGTE
jgi:integrase